MSLRIIVALLFLVSFMAKAAVLRSLSVTDNAQQTSLLCSLSGDFSHHLLILKHPDRVVVDFDNTTLAFPIRSELLKKGLILAVRTGHPTSHMLRLVLDVKTPVEVKTFRWPADNVKAKGLRIDLLKTAKVSDVAVSSRKKSSISIQPSAHLRDVIVVIDPGHGGKDPGAIGPGRVVEKNVVLAIAYKLKQQIDKQPGMRAVLTRSGDYYVGLRERLNIARRDNADIFISIHADAFINAHSNGASVFALSQTGATSEAARWLAEKENYSELGGVNLSHLNDHSGMIRTVLLDLSQTATISAGVQMGTEMLHHLGKITALHNRSVEQARFVVLKSPDIPSVLVETGFISNPREERNLSNPTYQSQLAIAIFSGVTRYFWNHPPYGTRLEALNRGSLHVVQAGEGLRSLALHYRISPSVLKSANHLSDDALFPGQKIIIPSSWT